jgi:MtN3 and saliva related transmembrane protein
MFLGFNMIQFVTALHGYMVKDYILMWGYMLSFFTCGWVVVLIIIYRKN